MTLTLSGLVCIWLTGAAVLGLFLLGRRTTRLDAADVALTSLLWPVFAAVLLGVLVSALCAALVALLLICCSYFAYIWGRLLR